MRFITACLFFAGLGVLGTSASSSTNSDDKLLHSYPLIMAHDAASGDIVPERDHVLIDWTRTQSVGMIGQLDCGARSFDYRPYLQGDVLFAHHGTVVVHKTMNSSVTEVIDWCNANPGELVVLYVTACDGDASCMDKSKELLKTLDVFTINQCSDLQSLTYGQAKELGKLSGGGSLIAVIECTTENYDPTINCYGNSFVCYDSWPEGTSNIPWTALSNHLLAVTAADPTVNNPNLWMAQAHWQSDAASIVLGTLHNSTLLLDESRGGVNVWVEKTISSGGFKFLNFLELDNVCDNGLNILAALKTTYL